MNQRYNLDNRHAPFNERYLERMWMVLNNAINQHSRTLAVITILRLPEYRDIGDSISSIPDHNGNIMSRFIESLREKITAYQNVKPNRIFEFIIVSYAMPGSGNMSQVKSHTIISFYYSITTHSIRWDTIEMNLTIWGRLLRMHG